MKTNNYQCVPLQTKYGLFNFYVWPTQIGNELIALSTIEININAPVFIRIHSECATGDIFGAVNCDCAQQLQKSLSIIDESKNGLLIYQRQEGRGIGLVEKVKSLKLQLNGLDTYEANITLGHMPDSRNYDEAIEIIKYFGIWNIKLLTNNPAKIEALLKGGFSQLERIPLVVSMNEYNSNYLTTKIIKFGHLL